MLFVRMTRTVDGTTVTALVSGGWADNEDGRLDAAYELRRLKRDVKDPVQSFDIIELRWAIEMQQPDKPPEIVDWAETEAAAQKLCARYTGLAEEGHTFVVVNA